MMLAGVVGQNHVVQPSLTLIDTVRDVAGFAVLLQQQSPSLSNACCHSDIHQLCHRSPAVEFLSQLSLPLIFKLVLVMVFAFYFQVLMWQKFLLMGVELLGYTSQQLIEAYPLTLTLTLLLSYSPSITRVSEVLYNIHRYTQVKINIYNIV